MVYKEQYNQQDLVAPFSLVDNKRELCVWLNCVLVHCKKGGRNDKEFTLAELIRMLLVPKPLSN